MYFNVDYYHKYLILPLNHRFSREILLSTIKTPLLSKVQQLLALMLHSTRPELTPRDFLHAARPPGFLPGHQQDSSEFLGYLLETLHDQERNANNCFYKSKQKRKEEQLNYLNGSGACGGDQNDVAMGNNDEDDDDEQRTLIQKTFGGKISITHKCLNCNSTNQIIDSFRDLQLSFPEYITDYTIQYLLDCYCTTEKLDGDNQYSCDECKGLSDGERYINILSPPKNLILTLKHFKYDQKYHVRAKLMHKVFLDDRIYLKLNSNGFSIKYRLYAAVVHSGISMDSGHYYTYAADQPDSWYKFNDSYVTKSSIDDLQNLTPPNTPYILFYQMCNKTNDDDDNNHVDDLRAQQRVKQKNNSSTDTNTDETLKKKPCLTNEDDDDDDVDDVDDVDEIMNQTKTNQIKKKCTLPALDELPIHLRELVNNDNVSYNEEISSKQQSYYQQQTKVSLNGRKTH